MRPEQSPGLPPRLPPGLPAEPRPGTGIGAERGPLRGRPGGSIAAGFAAVLAVAMLTLLAACSESTVATVEDGAGLLAPAEIARIESFHRLLLADHDIDYQVVTRANAGDLSRAAIDAFAERRVGAASLSGRGLLLLVDPVQNRIRLEVGTALEGVYVDAFVAYLEQRQMVPFFQRNRIADGILATSELIVDRALRAERQSGFAGESWATNPGSAAGGGASADARIGQAPAATTSGPDIIAAADSPSAVVNAYLAAMAARNSNPDASIFSAATRRMLANWVVTPAQMDTLVRSYRSCHAEAAQIAAELAVIRYAPHERACAPWFLIREEGAWRLDLTMMQSAIRFGRDNAWHFASGAHHPYAFAFRDWRFDANGFPLAN